MTRLLIGKIPQDFDLINDIVFAPFCFIGVQDNYPDLCHYKFQTDLKLSPEQKKNIDHLSTYFVLDYIKQNFQKYNKKNGLNYSYVFWNKILFTWLVSLVQHAYERELQVKKIIKNLNTPIQVDLVEENVEWNTCSTSDFLNLISCVEYNEWIISRLIENFKPKNWKISYKKSNFKYSNKISNKKFKNTTKYLLEKIFKRTNKIYGVNIFNQAIFEIQLRLKKPVKLNIKNYIHNPNKEAFGLSLDLDRLCCLTEPSFLRNIKKLADNYDRKFSKGKVILGGSQYLRGNDFFKIKIGLATENGELFIGTQHGGGSYGIAANFGEISQNEYNNFSFVTWGWKNHTEYNNFFKRLPSPFLLKFKDKHKFKNDEIILVGTKAHLSNRFLVAGPSENQWIDYRNNKLELFNNISKSNLKHKFFYKPSNNTIDSLHDKLFFNKKLPKLKIINSDFHDRILKCSLLIIDHPGTTLNIAMSANIPTVMFWDKEHFPHEKNAKEFLEKFEKNDMFFDCHEKLLNFLIKNENNFKDWWHNSKTQNLRLSWCENYAFSTNNWKDQWLKFIKDI